ncbi:MFS transporter [Streptomyces platensis]|uniref:MFS transporter n=1 Tax=Streptomyces platensis TaxID=58346 RepID=UPI002E16016B|nr:MFS transporter [Streptomyces platensis]
MSKHAAPTAAPGVSTPPTPTGSGTPAPVPRYWLSAGWVMTASGWSANQFSALLGSYRSELGLTTAVTTALFGIYVLGLIPGLLLGGPLADRRGRRPVVFLALGTSALATCLLMTGPASAVFLWPGRFLTGIGAGALLAAGSAWIKELSSPPYGTAPNPGVAARRSGLFLSAGFATGGLAASLIAQWAPHPMVTAYIPHLILSAVAALCAARAPESSPAHPGKASAAPAPGARREQRASAAEFRRLVAPVAPWVFIAPAVAFATLPGLVDAGLEGRQTVYAGVITAVTPGAGIMVAPFARSLAARHRIATGALGLAAIALGMLIAALAAAQAQPVVALIASMVLGAGYGLCVAYGLTEVAALAPAHRLARLTSYFWTLAYLGFLAPYVITLCTGLLAPPTILIGAAVLAVITLVVIAYRGTRQASAH